MGECRPYVENYTVDASIFDSTSSDVDQKQCFDSMSSDVEQTIGHVSASEPFGVRRQARFILMYVISSFKEQTVDALATGAEEGRSNLR
jgi:hypothetical protein